MRDSLGRVSSRDLTRDFFEQNPLDPKAWVRARNIPLFGDKALRTLTDLYDEAGWLGWATAAALTVRAKARRKADTPELAGVVDWGGWTPGDARAASKLIDENDTPQLQALLDRRLVTINGIEQTRYDQLAQILARGLAAGDSMGTVASNISGYLNTDLAWAEVVARTETRAAVTAASVDFYRSASVTQVEWLTAWDEACETCQGYQDLGPVDIETGFDGLDGPPGHPNCLCVVLPVVGEPEEAIEPEILPDDATEVVIEEPADTEFPKITKLSPDEIDLKGPDIASQAREVWPVPADKGEPYGAAFTEALGYDGLPINVSEQKMDALIESGWTEVFRGVTPSFSTSAEEITEQFRTGTLFNGTGVYGNGTYTTSNIKTAEAYAVNNGEIMRIAIPPDARIISFDDALQLSREIKEIMPEKVADFRGPDAYAALAYYSNILGDPGYCAMRAGYDLIAQKMSDGEMYYVILNRTAVAVQDTSITRG